MDLETLKNGLNYSRKNKKWALSMGILGLASYCAYRAYHTPAMVKKRQRLLKLIGSLASLAEMVCYSADAISVLSKDFNDFIQSDSDQVPTSIKQISKIAKSDEVSESVVRITKGITTGILQGYEQCSSRSTDSGCVDRVLDKLFTDAGSGFASVVVGSFAKNSVMALYSDNQSNGHPIYSVISQNGMRWVNNVVCEDKCRETIGNCVQLFVSSAVAVYLEKTVNSNTFDEIFSGLTNPKHETRVRDILVSLCQSSVETFVRTSHQVLSNVNSESSLGSDNGKKAEDHCGEDQNNVLGDRLCCSLCVPGNRRCLLELSGKVTYETVKSLQECVLEKLRESLRRRADVMHEKVGDMKHKSSAAITACLSLCLHIVNSPWLLVQP